MCSLNLGTFGLLLTLMTLGTVSMGSAGGFAQRSGLDAATPESDADPAYVLGYTMNTIDGTEKKLSDYKGKVVIMVNTASRCGLTPQYEGLEKLYRAHKDDGLVILGFPANNFGAQEPGSNKEIALFCSENYDVTFPMFEKISVKGEDKHPLYKQLAEQPEPIGQEPEWNFAKFLIGRDGRVVERFASRTKPDDEKFMTAIKAQLAMDSDS